MSRPRTAAQSPADEEQPRPRPAPAAQGAEARVPRWLATATVYSWRLLVVAAAIVATALALSHIALVVLPVIAALLLATFLAPPAAWLKRKGFPDAAAALVMVVVGLGVLAGAGAIIVPPVVGATDDLGDELTEAIDRGEEWLLEGPLDLSQDQLRDGVDRAADQLRGSVGTITENVVSGAILVAEVVAGMLLTLVLLFFFLKDGPRMWEWILGLFDTSRREVDELGRRAWATLGGYLRGVTVVAFVDASFIGLALLLIGVPLVLPLVVITFIGAYIPIVGATVSGLLAVLVALVSLGFVEALLVLAAIIAVQQLEGNVLQPVIVGRAVQLHPAVVLLAVTAGAVLYGIVGAFLAVPLVAVAASMVAYRRSDRPAPAARGAPGPGQPAGPSPTQ